MDHSERLSDIRERLRSIDDELEDLGLDVLRQAVENGATQRPPLEKPIAASRRAIDRAVRALDT